MEECRREIKVSTDTNRSLIRPLNVIDKEEIYEEDRGFVDRS